MSSESDREFERLSSRLSARIRKLDDENAEFGHELYVRDISEGGTFIETGVVMPPGTRIEVAFKHVHSEKTFSMLATVRRRTNDWPLGIGVQFDQAESHEQLDQVIDGAREPSLAPEPAPIPAPEPAPRTSRSGRHRSAVFFRGFDGESMKKVEDEKGEVQVFQRDTKGEYLPVESDEVQTQNTEQLLKLLAEGDMDAIKQLGYKIISR